MIDLLLAYGGLKPNLNYEQKIFDLERNYSHAYMGIVANALVYENEFLVPKDHLKQAFYMAFSRLKSVPYKDPSLCQEFLHYGLKHYADSGFQEMKHNFEEWIKGHETV